MNPRLFVILLLITLMAQIPAKANWTVENPAKEASDKSNQNKFTLQLTVNVDCQIFINDKNEGLLKAGDAHTIYLDEGKNKIAATPTDKQYEAINTYYEVSHDELNKENTMRLELSKKALNEKPEKENMILKILSNLIEKRKLSW